MENEGWIEPRQPVPEIVQLAKALLYEVIRYERQIDDGAVTLPMRDRLRDDLQSNILRLLENWDVGRTMQVEELKRMNKALWDRLPRSYRLRD